MNDLYYVLISKVCLVEQLHTEPPLDAAALHLEYYAEW